MSAVDSLPQDQKAVLQLLLKQGKTYEELAALLRLDPSAVRERAQNALAALGPDAPGGLTDARLDEIGDYLLGQQTASQRRATREFLEGSAAGRAWARVVASELRPLAGDQLPDVPAEGAEVAEAFDALEARRDAGVRQERSSRVGGILLIGAVAAVIVVLLIVVLGGGSDKKSKTSSTTASAPQTTASTGSTGSTGGTGSTGSTGGTGTTGSANVLAQINLFAVPKTAKQLGAAEVLVGSAGKGRALAVAAQGLPPGNHYAVWLYDSLSHNQFLGFAPAVASDGNLRGLLPQLSNAISQYKDLIVTRETVSRPTHPGTIVLAGTIGPIKSQ